MRFELGLILIGIAATAVRAASYPQPHESDFVIRDFHFHSGETLAETKLHYTTIGTPKGNNAVLIMHGTGGAGTRFLSETFAGALFGAGQPLDATRYFIILPDDVGHGKSSKPSDGLHFKFPRYGYQDSVTLEYRLITEGLGLKHLRLVMGTSMGAMHTWMWGERYPDFMDALMPLASLPVEIAGRNRFFRRMMIDSIRDDPEHGLKSGVYALIMMTSSPLQMQKEAPTREQADKLFDETVRKRMDTNPADDFLYQADASRDYNPAPDIEKIKAPLLAINSADDEVNPPELGILEREIKRVKQGRYVLIPIGPETRGHGTHSVPAVWRQYLLELLAESTPYALPVKHDHLS